MAEELLQKWRREQHLLLALAMELPPADPRVEERLEGQLRRSLHRLEEVKGGGAYVELLLEWSRTQEPAIAKRLQENAPLWEAFAAVVAWKG